MKSGTAGITGGEAGDGNAGVLDRKFMVCGILYQPLRRLAIPWHLHSSSTYIFTYTPRPYFLCISDRHPSLRQRRDNANLRTGSGVAYDRVEGFCKVPAY